MSFNVSARAAAWRGLSPWVAAGNLLAIGSVIRFRTPLKFFVRSLGQPRLTHAWLARIVQPDLAPLWAAHPRLATKLQRPYVSSAWSKLERFGALIGHYDALPRFFRAAVRQAIYREGVVLFHLMNESSGRRLEVSLVYRDQFEKEGELTLLLRDVAAGVDLAGITFCVACNAGQRVLIVGGLQASPHPQMRELIHDVAKECHGLRPKAFALWCLQQLASVWKVAQIQAVDDAQHIYRDRHKRREIAASYNEFWSESDGRRIPGGAWELPLVPRLRARAELKPNRRKAYERRYAMLDAIRPGLLDIVRSLAPDARHGEIPGHEPPAIILKRREPSAPAKAAVDECAAEPSGAF
ncbi:MAG: hypothetical protein JWM88_869 [Verrucomicrobia bacterium]|nr:hypothetical protein [Verrucomicrobiota bacterium]